METPRHAKARLPSAVRMEELRGLVGFLRVEAIIGG